jgi:hypothetical protein
MDRAETPNFFFPKLVLQGCCSIWPAVALFVGGWPLRIAAECLASCRKQNPEG